MAGNQQSRDVVIGGYLAQFKAGHIRQYRLNHREIPLRPAQGAAGHLTAAGTSHDRSKLLSESFAEHPRNGIVRINEQNSQHIYPQRPDKSALGS
ncbi:MAG TPA: hypothetical protein VL614_31220 [Acetobacteraceae bacterium]|nr:hypothetical protein [Acetobacteraceae bacterium]